VWICIILKTGKLYFEVRNKKLRLAITILVKADHRNESSYDTILQRQQRPTSPEWMGGSNHIECSPRQTWKQLALVVFQIPTKVDQKTEDTKERIVVIALQQRHQLQQTRRRERRVKLQLSSLAIKHGTD
jgi:hypothetical protein